MGLLNLAALAAGIVLIAVGYGRARGPWQRYRALQEQDRNIARYEAWRGGVRDRSPTGASVAMQLLRRQVQTGAAVVIVGFALLLAGFAIK
jgi:hypothetical protein